MKDEFVLVRYRDRIGNRVVRRVYIDGDPTGWTEGVLPIEQGEHTFHLGTGDDYWPPQQTVTIQGTVPLRPEVIEFGPKAGIA
jgi:hypothetical protein